MKTSIDLACRLLCACEAAYCIANNAKDGQYNPCDHNKLVTPGMITQYKAVNFVDNPYIITSAQIEAALVGQTEAGIIISLRGTLKPALTVDSVLDWIQDLAAVPSSDPHLTGKVHSGFLFAVKQLADGINTAVNDIQKTSSTPLNVYVTGHSKGGGMAPIVAMYLANKYGMNITQSLFFAGPNPGDSEFCKAFDSMFPNTIRYQNYMDIVPLLPPFPLVISTLELVLADILPGELKKLLNAAKNWDYSCVGTMMYIDKDRNVIKKSTLEADITDTEDWTIITTALLSGDVSAIASAHHSACHYGYMLGTCKDNVCG